jgi:branched-chain amino acid transport system permease protein
MLVTQQIINGVMLGGIYALVAVAFTLTIGVLNFLNFTIPVLFMLAGMCAWALTTYGVHWAAAAACGILVSVAVALLVERVTYRYLKTRYGDATEHALPLVSSLGFLILFENLVLVAWGSDPQTFPSPFRGVDVRIEGLIIRVPQLVSLALAVALVWALTRIIRTTRLGRALRAIAENPDAATLMGVDVMRIVPAVFLITGLLSGLAGILFTVNYVTVTPFMGDNVGTKAIAAMVIGGVGNIWGAIAGGLLVGLTEVLSIHFFGADTVKVTVWGTLLAILLVRPTGLFGRVAVGKGKF